MPVGIAKLSVRNGYDELANRNITTLLSAGRRVGLPSRLAAVSVFLGSLLSEAEHCHAGTRATGSAVGSPALYSIGRKSPGRKQNECFYSQKFKRM